MTPAEMDELFAAHCAAEDAKDTEAILATLAEDVEHDVVGDPAGVLRDGPSIAKRYQELFAALDDEKLEPLRRYHGEDFFVDESRLTGRVVADFMGMPGHGQQVDFRMLHVCEVRDGKISRENVWLDVATLMQQLAAP